MAEEAAAVAQEFVSSLDNVSSEVAFLLNEIRVKDERSVELTTRLTSRTSSHLKHIRPSSTLSTPNPNIPTVLNPATAKEVSTTLPKIASEFDKLTAIQAEKVVLAERLMTLVGKHARKLELEVVGKVADLGGVPAPAMLAFHSAVTTGGLTEKKSLGGGGNGPAGSSNGPDHKRRRTSQLGFQPATIQMPPPPMSSYSMQPNSRHSPLSTSSYMPPQPTPHQLATSYQPYNNHHLVPSFPTHPQPPNSQAQAYPPPPPSSTSSRHPTAYPPHAQHPTHPQSSSTSSTAYAHPQPPSQPSKSSKRKRKSVQVQSDEDDYLSASGVQVVVDDLGGDEDAVGEEEEEEDGGDDDTLYCYCKQKSHGEMVGCDNEKCAIEWFHMRCVNLTSPLPESWFCPTCVAQGADRKKKGGRR